MDWRATTDAPHFISCGLVEVQNGHAIAIIYEAFFRGENFGAPWEVGALSCSFFRV